MDSGNMVAFTIHIVSEQFTHVKIIFYKQNLFHDSYQYSKAGFSRHLQLKCLYGFPIHSLCTDNMDNQPKKGELVLQIG